MTQSFLDSVKKAHGDGVYAGDEYGGARGNDGSGLPTGSDSNFMFATGIECSNPTIDNGRTRRDLLAECGHYDRWQEDLNLVRDMGLRALRYGLPIHRIFLGPGKYDWSFADLAMAEIKRLEIEPILDLLHFGLPDWLGDFQNPDFPLHFAAYCDAVAERYPWARYYTPVNEIYVTARSSAKDGVWNEQLKTDRAFVTAIKHLAAASILGNQMIAARRPDCIIVQSESAEYIHEARATPSREITLVNKQRLISLDLL
ncbi:MAG: family 1 glycosylhydrolase, partial [Janthinobacterium lividum]